VPHNPLSGPIQMIGKDHRVRGFDLPHAPLTQRQKNLVCICKKFCSPSNFPCLLVFQQMEVDYHIGDAVKGMPGNEEGPVPVIRFYGVTAEGNSVFLQAHGFMPYFYIRAPQGWDDSYCANFREALNVRTTPSHLSMWFNFVSFRNAWLRRQEIRENSGVIIFWM